MEEGLISVDRWSEPSQAYFLSHLHTDHTKGLSRRWKRGPLFCSSITAKLLPTRFPGFNLSLLRVLEIGTPHSVSLVSPKSGLEITVQVVAIDANHCPGAVMYLFHGEFGSMLYTGDFRWETTSDRTQIAKAMLLNALGDDKLGMLYLDNTYCNPWFSFPPREVVAQQVVDLIASHPDHDIVIGINTLGKEDLLLHISRALKTKIWVWPERLQTMHILSYGDIFTTNTSITRVRAVPRESLTIDNLKALNTVRPTIGIMPSGLPWVRPANEKDASHGASHSNRHKRKMTIGGSSVDSSKVGESPSSPLMLNHHVYSVPYSDHSCFTEIREFIEFIRPSYIKGIVSSSTWYINPFHYFGNLCGAHKQMEESSKNIRSDLAENVEIIQTESSVGHDKFDEVKISTKVVRQAARKSRVSVVRRERKGVRITHMDDSSRTDFDV
ncbi:uncharacterized protein LOC131238967 [Magnolia sinica]|uniref:uncharacterized protein LOC131238967 n=1 Tax=Magnolia sinica TaxID=86752 RepID=UPI0026590ED2|nr:uncharacterized protein LOC131238967 [Magnolia sinica]